MPAFEADFASDDGSPYPDSGHGCADLLKGLGSAPGMTSRTPSSGSGTSAVIRKIGRLRRRGVGDGARGAA